MNNNSLSFTIGDDSESQLITHDTLTSLVNKEQEYYIIKLEEIVIGDYFNGLVYVRQSSCKQNRLDKTKYDLRLQCVDGTGKIFNLTIFKLDERIEITNKVAYINEGQKVIAYNRVFYNATSVRIHTDSNYPINAFLRYIDDIDAYKEEYKKLITTISQNETYKNVLIKLEKDLQITNKLQTTAYPHQQGGRIGEFLKVVVEVNNLYKNWGTSVNKRTDKELQFFGILSLVALTQLLNNEHSKFNNNQHLQQDNESANILLEPYIINIIYSTGLTENEVGILTQTIAGHQTYKQNESRYSSYSKCLNQNNSIIVSPIQYEFYKCLQTIEDKLIIDNENQHI